MPEKFSIIGTGRTPMTDDDFRAKLLDGVNKFSRSGEAAPEKWAEFSPHISYEAADVNNYETYAGICKRVSDYESSGVVNPISSITSRWHQTCSR